MAVVKKTISLPEELYNEAKNLSKNFSELVKEALEEYLEKKKIEKILSFAGKLKNLEDGVEFVDRIRNENKILEEKRRKSWDI